MSKEEILKYAAEAIEKQIPQKPNIYGDGYDDDGNLIYDMYDCPNCDSRNENLQSQGNGADSAYG